MDRMGLDHFVGAKNGRSIYDLGNLFFIFFICMSNYVLTSLNLLDLKRSIFFVQIYVGAQHDGGYS